MNIAMLESKSLGADMGRKVRSSVRRAEARRALLLASRNPTPAMLDELRDLENHIARGHETLARITSMYDLTEADLPTDDVGPRPPGLIRFAPTSRRPPVDVLAFLGRPDVVAVLAAFVVGLWLGRL